jgi:hypothetical protein
MDKLVNEGKRRRQRIVVGISGPASSTVYAHFRCFANLASRLISLYRVLAR